jgi:diguanylate cyclase (GGDEF)-like protein/PAS domain S-box-containing protein
MPWLRAPVVLFLLAILTIGGVTSAAVAMRASVRASDGALAQAALDLGDAERLRGLRERVSRKARTFLLSGDQRYLLELREAELAFRRLVSERQAVAKSRRERELLDQVEERERARGVVTDRLIESRNAGITIEAIVSVLESDLQPTLDSLDGTIRRMVEFHQNEVARARDASERASKGAITLVWLATGLAMLVSGLSSVALARTLRRLEGRAERTRRHLAAIVESTEDAVYSADLGGRLLTWNRSAQRVFGYDPDEILGREVSQLLPGDLVEGMPMVLEQMTLGAAIPHLETLHKTKDGRLIDVVLSISPIRDEQARVTGASIIARDVTEQRRLRRERDRFFELSLDMVCVAGTDGYFKQLNPTFEVVLGHTRATLLDRPFLAFVHEDDQQATLEVLATLAAGRPAIDFENRYRCKDGSYRWLSWHATPEADGTIYALARDVTERKATQEQLSALTEDLRVMAVVDELTGLHNRRGFNILAEQELARARRNRQQTAFFFADLDGLKRINDEHGHEVGDRAIADAGALLRSAFRKSDIVARLGGDEFVVLCTDGAAGTEAPLARLEGLVREYNASLPARPFELAISIGSATHDPDHAEPIDDILRRADKVMYEQKARRKASARAAPETATR